MPILPSEVIARTISVLEDVCLLLDDEIVERAGEQCALTDDALKCASALEAVRTSIPKLRVAEAVLAASDRLQSAQGDLLSEGNASEATSDSRHACGAR